MKYFYKDFWDSENKKCKNEEYFKTIKEKRKIMKIRHKRRGENKCYQEYL
jgi:hypothetical protein